MHNHDGKSNKSMMWIMVICCAVPLVLIIILGAGGKALGTPAWIIFGGITAMAVAHFFMMSKSRKHSNGEQTTVDGKGKNKDGENKNHSGHGCCH